VTRWPRADPIKLWTDKRATIESPAFASASTILRPERIDVELTGHHLSLVMERGRRHYMFQSKNRRDIFVELYAGYGAIACEDPIKDG
jgi:hypothetical protein